MSAPKRIQLSRRKGWRKPEGAIVVARPSKWGNPFKWHAQPWFDGNGNTGPADPAEARRIAVAAYRDWLGDPNGWRGDNDRRGRILGDLHELAGHDLACWCPLDQPCHADVLLELANKP